MSDVVIVGPCGAGKTTLANSLKLLGYRARAVAQEHTGIRELWRHAGQPVALIFLDATAVVISARRQHDFPEWLLAEQYTRLADARAHAQLEIDTVPLTPGQVRELVVAELSRLGIEPS